MNLETEMTLVKSVYCRDGEFVGDIENSCKMRRVSLNLRPRVCFTLIIPQEYPLCVPHVTISYPVLPRSQVTILNNDLRSFYFKNYEESGMILSVITWLTENVSPPVEKATQAGIDRVMKPRVCIMRIDHMRARDSYLKSLKKWSEQLQTNTIVLFSRRLILLTIRGMDTSIEEFIKRLRSRKVDIDAAGKPCKERMMSVLCNQPHDSQYEVEFSVTELQDSIEISNFFLSMIGIEKVYEDFIAPNN